MPPSVALTPSVLRRHTAPDMDKITKKSPPRNTKAWTLEDERALLQGRLERIPYKQIGARIGKTDLACRLHFHQMVMAKRTPQTAPGRSIAFLSSEHPPEIHRLAPTDQTLIASTTLSAVCGLNPSATNDRICRDAGLKEESVHRRSHSSPLTDQDRDCFLGRQSIAASYASPRIDGHASNTVDLGRLNSIYRQHATDFWSTVATKYSAGEALSPSRLEHAFLHHSHSVEKTTSGIPRITVTPDGPPQSPSPLQEPPRDTTQRHGPRHSRSISDTSIAGRCSVESLLNHGRP